MPAALYAGLIALLAVSAVCAQDPVPVDREISRTAVLRLVDANYPGLEGFGAALAAGEEAKAQGLLIQHFATRTRPVIPPAIFPGLGEGNSSTILGKASPETAAQWLKHVFTLSNNDIGKMETFDLGPEIQWTRNPSAALSWILYLNQLNHLNGLAGLYAETRDEKLAQEIGHSVLTWSQQCSRGYGYTNRGELVNSGMEVRNRLCNLLATYDVVRRSPSLTPEMHLAFWKVFIACARELKTYEGVTYPGLIPLAVLYPEFTESKQWLQWGEANLRFCLVDRTSPDGAWDTQSISYQTVPVPWAARTLEFLQANPESGDYAALADMVKTQMGKLLGLMLWIAMPNGGLPNVGDTYGRADWGEGLAGSLLRSYIHTQFPAAEQARLNAVADPYARLTAALTATEGTKDATPRQASLGLVSSGYYVMRSSWAPCDSRYLYLDLTPQGMGHAHNDAGHFDLYAYGKPLLADTGDYFLGWGYRAALHNTLEVDGLDQARGAQAAPMRPHEWLSTAAFDFADVAHGAYSAQGIEHRRKLLFVKPDYFILCDLLTGTGRHKYEQFFHFAGRTQLTAATAKLDDQTLVAATTDEGVANVQIVPAHTTGLTASFVTAQDTDMKTDDKYERAAMLGWMVTDGTFRRVKAPVVDYVREGEGPQAFYDVLYPSAPNATATVRVETLPVTTPAGQALPPTEAAGLVVHGTVTRPKVAPDQLQLDLGPNLAQGKPGLAEINQTSMPPTTSAITDGDRSPRTLGTGVSSSPYTPGVLLKGRFTVDLQGPTEVNCVVLAHGIWNGSAIIYPAEKLAVQYWDGTQWRDVADPQTTWLADQVTQTFFAPVTTTRLSVAVERSQGGRLALREFEAYRVADRERQRIAALRAETVTEEFTDTILLSQVGPGARRYGEYSFDGELALLRRDGTGRLTEVCLKGGSTLSLSRELSLRLGQACTYCNLTLQAGQATVDGPAAGQAELTANGARVKLVAADGQSLPATNEPAPKILDARVQLLPAQAGFAAAQPSAVITWRTDVPATGQVAFGAGDRLDRRTVLDTRLTTAHEARAWFLEADRQYRFEIVSQSRGGTARLGESGR